MTSQEIDKILKDPAKYALSVSVDKLVEILKYVNDAYFNSPDKLISDETYDILYEVLKTRDPQNEFFQKVGAPVSNKVKLPYYMASLDKIKMDEKIFSKWMTEYKGPYNLSDKIDGVSALLHIDSGKNIKALYTRGDGHYGQDISFLIDIINGIVLCDDHIVIRGELIITKDKFKKLNSAMDNSLKNARNTVAGIVNSKMETITNRKTNSYKIAKAVSFIAYEMIYPSYNVKNQYKIMKTLGFKVPYNMMTKTLTLEYLNELLKNRREEAEYDIDGIVVKDNNMHNIISGENPQNAFAFKTILSDQIAETTVLRVEWDISKDKILNPVVIIEPVMLGGAEIQRATAFNAKFIRDSMLGPGAVIKIIRSGDVIPYILGIVIPAEKWAEPENIRYEWNKSNVDIVAIIDGNTDKSIVDKYNIVLIAHFFDVLQVDNMGHGIIAKLYNSGCDTIKKIINMTIEDFLLIEGFKKVLATKIHNNIQNAITNIDLSKLMTASNVFGRGFSTKKFETLLGNISYEKMIKIFEKDPQKLVTKIIDIDGFSNITSNQFVGNFQNFIDFMKLYPEIKLNKEKKMEKASSILAGQKIAFSGFRDNDLEQLIIKNGGTLSNTVTSKTTILLIKDNVNMNSSKILKAKQLNIPITNVDMFISNNKL
jgi:DNA ligase (NAD+)